MMLGLSLEAFTLVHVVLSLIGIATGFVAVFGMMSGRKLDVWTAVFLFTTIMTSVTGFGFPFEKLLPSHIVGILSLIALGLAVAGLYVFGLQGPWRRIYTITSSISLYFNVFVAVAQSFQKIPALKALAPTQSEGPFVVAQLIVLVAFAVIGYRATSNFHPLPTR